MPKVNFDSPSERFMYEHGVPVEQIVAQRSVIENFSAQAEEERLAHSRAQIVRMKQRFEAKKIDFNKVRWDARRARFVPVSPTPAPARPALTAGREIQASRARSATGLAGAGDRLALSLDAPDWSAVTKETAEHIARLNGVWKDSYEKLRGTGRIVMTVCNVLKGKAKRGEQIKWQ